MKPRQSVFSPSAVGHADTGLQRGAFSSATNNPETTEHSMTKRHFWDSTAKHRKPDRPHAHARLSPPCSAWSLSSPPSAPAAGAPSGRRSPFGRPSPSPSILAPAPPSRLIRAPHAYRPRRCLLLVSRVSVYRARPRPGTPVQFRIDPAGTGQIRKQCTMGHNENLNNLRMIYRLSSPHDTTDRQR